MEIHSEYNTTSEQLGLIPYMVQKAFMVDEVKDIVPALEDAYGFPLSEMGGAIDDKGTYIYTGDPDLLPLVYYRDSKHPDVVIYQYAYGIVGVVHTKDGEQTQFITRMD